MRLLREASSNTLEVLAVPLSVHLQQLRKTVLEFGQWHAEVDLQAQMAGLYVPALEEAGAEAQRRQGLRTGSVVTHPIVQQCQLKQILSEHPILGRDVAGLQAQHVE